MPSRTIATDLIVRFLAGDASPAELPEPAWGPIGKEVYDRTYSREIPTGELDADGNDVVRNEVWAETVRRVVTGNLAYAPEGVNRDNEAVELFDLVYNFAVIPAGRHLWVTGTTSPYTRNCWFSSFEKRTSEHFRFLASRLFEGGGVGSNYSSDFLALTDPIVGRLDVSVTCDPAHVDYQAAKAKTSHQSGIWRDADELAPSESLPGIDGADTFKVEDSREGWVALWVHMIDLSTQPGVHRLIIDLSDVRPHGAPLRTFGGKASGPAPLAEAIADIVSILNSVAGDEHGAGRRLTGLEAMSIDHAIAASVVAGGTRRSARMSLMHWADPAVFEFIKCKSDTSHHWSTNISVEIDDGFHAALAAGSPQAEAVLRAVAVGMASNGEPGLFDASAHSVGEPEIIRGCNPCGEVSLGAWESCNLGSVNLEAFGEDTAGALRAFNLTARFLYRATLRPYPDPKAAEVEGRNRRIGVGLLGLQGWCAANGRKLSELHLDDRLMGLLSEFRVAARQSADEIADTLGLPRPVKVTSIAPTGTIAQMPGITPGVHPVFARYFIRRVRYSDTDPQLVELAERGFHVEDDQMAASTKVVSFPVRDAILDRYDEGLIEQSDELGFGEFMRLLQTIQDTFCAGSDGNAISATAQIPQGMDPAGLVAVMRPLIGTLKGITAFPTVSRPQPPYEPLSRGEFEVAVAELERRAGGVKVNVTGDSNDGSCDTGACPIR